MNAFPTRVETPLQTLVGYRVLIAPASPGPWEATIFTKDAHERRKLDRVSRVVPLGNRQWLVIGETEAWRVTHTNGCGCTSSTTGTAPEVTAWLGDVVEQEEWEQVVGR